MGCLGWDGWRESSRPELWAACGLELHGQPTLVTALSGIAFDPRTPHLLNDGRINDQTAERRNSRHVQPGEPMHRLHEDSQVGQVPTRCLPNRERREGVYRRVAQLTQLLVLKPIEDAKVSIWCPWSDQGPGAIRRAQTVRVGFTTAGAVSRPATITARKSSIVRPAPPPESGTAHTSSSGTSCSRACTRRGRARNSPGSIRIVKRASCSQPGRRDAPAKPS